MDTNIAANITTNIDAGRRSLITALLVEGSLILFLNITTYEDLPFEDQHVALWSVLFGIIVLLGGVLSIKSDKFYNWLCTKLQKIGAWFNISSSQVVPLLTSPLFGVLAINAAGFWLKMRSPYAAVVAWLLGMVLALVGGWRLGEEKPRLSKATLFWLAGVTLFAFLLRGVATKTFPILLTGDEASAGVSAINYAKGEWNNLFIVSWFSFPSLFSFLQSLGVRIFGNTIEALRIPSALVGALTVGVVYLCGRSMFGQRAGVFAALTLAALHFHIHFSRLGLNNIWDGLWFTLTIGALWLGWKKGLRWAYLLAGLSLGFSQYFYSSSKALIGVVFAAAFLALLFQRARFRQALPDFCVVLIAALVVVLPLAWYYKSDPRALLAPFARVSMVQTIGSSGAAFRSFLSQQVPISLGAYTHTQFTPSSFWYPPNTPLLRPIAATFFGVGLIFLLFHDRDSRLALLSLWLVAIAMSNALSSTIPAAQRYVAAAPACALVAGYGLHKIAETLASLWPKFQRSIAVAAYLVLACIVVSDLWFYFVDYTALSRKYEMTSNGMVAHEFGNYLKGEPAGTQVVFFGIPRLAYDSPAILYLAPQIKGINAPLDWGTFDLSQLTSPKVIFIFLPEYQDKIKIVQESYPGGSLTTEKARNGDALYWVYERIR